MTASPGTKSTTWSGRQTVGPSSGGFPSAAQQPSEDDDIARRLIAAGVISAELLPGLLEIQRRHAAAGQPVRLAQLVVARGFATREAVLAALGPPAGRPRSGVSEDELPTLRPLTDSADETTTLKLNRGQATPVHEDRVGEGEQRLGAYIVERELGRGGMGAVLLARDPRLGRRVAIKQILVGLEGELDGTMLERFDAEARLGARLRHPGIAGVHELVTEGEGAPYLVMEYVEGRSLKEAFKFQSFSGARLAGILRQLCEALEVAHGLGIIHRDLKPDNVVLAEGDRPVVLDFGIAKDVERSLSESRQSLTKTGDIMGTPAFMSPEQADSSKDVDARTDVYALGGILYQGLAGRPPFTGNAQQVLAAIFAKDPEPPSALGAEVHPDLETIALKCLEKNPDGRYQSAAALGEELGRFLDGEPIQARPVSRGRRLWRRVKRSRGPLLVAALLLIVLGLGGTLALREPGLDQEIYGEALRALDELGEIQTFRYRPLMEKEEDEEALIRRARERTEAVLKRLDTLVAKSGGDPRLLVLKAKALSDIFRWDEAGALLNEAIRANGTLAEAHEMLGKLSMSRSAFEWFAESSSPLRKRRVFAEDAIRHFRMAEELGGAPPDGMARFWRFLGEGRPDAAREQLASLNLDQLGLEHRFARVLLTPSEVNLKTLVDVHREMAVRLEKALETCPRHFPSLVLSGRLKQRRGAFAEALPEARLAVMMNPESYSARLLLGEISKALELFKDAERHFKAAAKLRLDESVPCSRLSSLYFSWKEAGSARSYAELAKSKAKNSRERSHAHLVAALAATMVEDFETFQSELREASAIAPNDPEILRYLGAGLCRDGRPKEGVKVLNRALGLMLRAGKTPDPGLLLHRGMARRELGDPDGAFKDFLAAKALLGDQRRPDVRRPLGLNLAEALRERGRRDEAFRELEDLRRRGMEDSEVLAALAFLKILEDQIEEAEKLSLRALKSGPDGHGANAVRAAVCLLKKEWKEAEQRSRFVLKLSPDNPDLLSILGEALRQQKQFDEAGRVLRRTLELKPTDARALRALGGLAARQRNWKLAEQCLESFLKSYNPRYEVLKWLAQAKNELGEPRVAAKLLDRALAIFAGDPNVHCLRGFVAFNLRDWTTAVRSFDRTLKIRDIPHSMTPILGRREFLPRASRLADDPLPSHHPEGPALAGSTLGPTWLSRRPGQA